MPGAPVDADSWKRIVLQGMAPPSWLSDDGPFREIVLSTRVRYMRNLRGRKFPHAASPIEMRETGEQIVAALGMVGPFEILRSASPAERDYLVACRLVSPDFDWSAPGRALACDSVRCFSAMVNEEDHLRIQAITPGWSFRESAERAQSVVEGLARHLDFAQNEKYGYLAASASNCGSGIRYSAMFHLIGLAHFKRLGTVIKALTSQGLVVRGLFGERSRAVGALVQISTTAASIPLFVGACEYVLGQERTARAGASTDTLANRLDEAAEFVQRSQALTLADALRVLAWLRWNASGGNVSLSAREVDALIPELALLESLGEGRAPRSRLTLLRKSLGL
jgi:protein arginine kinase